MRSAPKSQMRRLTHRWMREDQSFPAHFELLLYDKPVSLWRLISENETKCSNFEQNWSTKSQKVKRQPLTHRWMRQKQSFPAQVELLLYDKPVRLWRLLSENETNCSNFEQNRPTKSPKAAGVRIVLKSLNQFAISVANLTNL